MKNVKKVILSVGCILLLGIALLSINSLKDKRNNITHGNLNEVTNSSIEKVNKKSEGTKERIKKLSENELTELNKQIDIDKTNLFYQEADGNFKDIKTALGKEYFMYKAFKEDINKLPEGNLKNENVKLLKRLDSEYKTMEYQNVLDSVYSYRTYPKDKRLEESKLIYRPDYLKMHSLARVGIIQYLEEHYENYYNLFEHVEGEIIDVQEEYNQKVYQISMLEKGRPNMKANKRTVSVIVSNRVPRREINDGVPLKIGDYVGASGRITKPKVGLTLMGDGVKTINRSVS